MCKTFSDLQSSGRAKASSGEKDSGSPTTGSVTDNTNLEETGEH